jgi:hypothetical protein
MSDPLMGHLADLCREAPAGSFILGGGLALRVRREMLLRSGASTLARGAGYELPEARATTDIDAFLRLEVFERGDRQVRDAIDRLGYRVRTAKWQFQRPLYPGAEEPTLILDLMSAWPPETTAVAVHGIRVGSGSRADLHGHGVEEAFAVERDPREIALVKNGVEVARPHVAHPFAMLCMKVRASHDWLRYKRDPWTLGPNRKPPSEKHAFDVALCVAMLTEDERDECIELASAYADHPIAGAIRSEAAPLFGTPNAPGWRSAVHQGLFDDHDLVWEALRACLAVAAP